MPDLLNTLQGSDPGFLRIIASAWGIDLKAGDAYSTLPVLIKAMSSPALIEEIFETLPPDLRSALEYLLNNGGQATWSVYTHHYGDIRVMGSARRDRERPYLQPVSAVEALWYRGLIGRAFLDIPPEPQECAFIPEELYEHLARFARQALASMGRAATSVETAHTLPASDHILDHACTLLAALRLGLDLDQLDCMAWGIPPRHLLELLRAAGLVDRQNTPLPEPARAFLESPRAGALAMLAASWQKSREFDELRLLSGLRVEGELPNDPLRTRQALLERIKQVPSGAWWSLPAFVNAMHQHYPDFQRSAGEYDSWFIRSEPDGVYLRGFASWDQVEGALIRYLITGPLFWLGFVELSGPDTASPPAAFRFTPWLVDLWQGRPPSGLEKETAPVHINADGHLRLERLTPRAARYQIARFCAWQDESASGYRYRLTPSSLERARQQGLRPVHLLGLLRKYGSGPLPPQLVQALERWEKFGVQASVEKVSILRVTSPEILDALRRTRAGRFLGEALTPTVITLKPGGGDAVQSALAAIGYLGEVVGNKGTEPGQTGPGQ